MTAVIDSAQCRFDVVPAPFIVKATSNEFADERAASSGTSALIEFDDEVIGHGYV